MAKGTQKGLPEGVSEAIKFLAELKMMREWDPSHQPWDVIANPQVDFWLTLGFAMTSLGWWEGYYITG